MEIQWSLVLFTAIAGTGSWLLGCACIDEFKGMAKKTTSLAAVIAIVLLIAGGIVSATHLSHVDRMFGVLAHPAPGIFLEALLLGIDALIGLILVLLWKRDASAGARKAFAALGVIMAPVFSFSCGFSYMMSSQLAWNNIGLPLGYLGTAAAAGCALWALLCAYRGEAEEALVFAGWETVLGGALAVVFALVFGMVSGVSAGAQAPLFWGAVVLVGGVAPLACGVAITRKPASALAFAGLALACGCVGAIAFRCLMWLGSDALMALFGVTL
ncbi:MAG: dimethyl sulfoxide reductase anchor subunit [Eggerthellaceae bacterium]|nr:dimethyl sulfoxide reductase anchor subunit [Eggerthellaceae bacterium]